MLSIIRSTLWQSHIIALLSNSVFSELESGKDEEDFCTESDRDSAELGESVDFEEGMDEEAYPKVEDLELEVKESRKRSDLTPARHQNFIKIEEEVWAADRWTMQQICISVLICISDTVAYLQRVFHSLLLSFIAIGREGRKQSREEIYFNLDVIFVIKVSRTIEMIGMYATQLRCYDNEGVTFMNQDVHLYRTEMYAVIFNRI